MALNADELGKRLAALSERFAGLAETLAQTAGQLQASGSLPAESLIDEITKIRTDFVDVRQRVLEAARSLSINAPGMSEVDSLKALGPVLETVVRALAMQEKRAALAEARTKVMAVLDRGLTVSHRARPQFRGLVPGPAQAAPRAPEPPARPVAAPVPPAPALEPVTASAPAARTGAEQREAAEAVEQAAQDEAAQWWVSAWARWTSWKGTLSFADAVKEELGKYNYILSVPIQKSTGYEEGLLAYGYSILLEHIEHRYAGVVNKALNSLKTFQPGASGQSRSVGAHLYNVLVSEGRLAEEYPEFVKSVLLAAVPEPGLWTHARILESTTETRIFTHPSNRIGDPEHNSQRLTQRAPRFPRHRFPT